MPVLHDRVVRVLTLGRAALWSDVLVPSQCNLPKSMPNSAIAPAPTVAGDPLQLRGDRVQSPGRMDAVQQTRIDAEPFLHHPGMNPVTHPHQRSGRGEPVGHHGLDDLAVRQKRARADRTHFVDDPGQLRIVDGPGMPTDSFRS